MNQCILERSSTKSGNLVMFKRITQTLLVGSLGSLVLGGCDEKLPVTPMSLEQVRSHVSIVVPGLDPISMRPTDAPEFWDTGGIKVAPGTGVSIHVDRELLDAATEIYIRRGTVGREIAPGETVIIEQAIPIWVTVRYVGLSGLPEQFGRRVHFDTRDGLSRENQDVLDWEYALHRIDLKNTRVRARFTLPHDGVDPVTATYDVSDVRVDAQCSPLYVENWPDDWFHFIDAVAFPPKSRGWPSYDPSPDSPTAEVLAYESSISEDGIHLTWDIAVNSTIGPLDGLSLNGPYSVTAPVEGSDVPMTREYFLDSNGIWATQFFEPHVRYSSDFPAGISLASEPEPAVVELVQP